MARYFVTMAMLMTPAFTKAWWYDAAYIELLSIEDKEAVADISQVVEVISLVN